MEKYFKDQTLMYEFFLLELEGTCRMEKLNITRDKFMAKKLADNWYNKIRKHLKDERAIEELEDIYKSMLDSCYM